MNAVDKYETYPLYIKLTAGTCLLLLLGTGVLSYVLWPGLHQINLTLAFIIETFLFMIPLFFLAMFLVMALALWGCINVSPLLLRISNKSLYMLFPFTIGIGRICGITKERISQSLIDMINVLVRRNLYRIEPEKILLLTPHCLQKNTCIHKVTSDVYNCKQCGQCQVGELLKIAQQYGCQFILVTGGTLARMMVKQARPKAIVAIACERDLVSGMQDVFPIPVIGVLNERPCGPCFNTRVNTEEIEKVVKQLIYGYEG